MPKVIRLFENEECECCGSREHGRRVDIAFCYHGYPPDFSGLGGHGVKVPYLANLGEIGWGMRAGTLPICPAHLEPGDVTKTGEVTCPQCIKKRKRR